MNPIIASGGGNTLHTILSKEVVQLMPLEVIVLFTAIFIVIGFGRGVRAELWITTFILVAFVVLAVAGDTLVTWANRIYKLARFALAGGIIAENPVDIWQNFADSPPLIESDAAKLWFRIGVFVVLYLVGFIIGRLRAQRALTPISLRLVRELPDLGERLLGAVMGAVNGFLIAFFVLPQVLPADKATVVVVPQTNVVTNFMSENVVNVAFALVVIIILLGLMASGGLRQGR